MVTGENPICEPVTSAIANCRSYSGATSCQTCEQEYYINNLACTAVDSTKIITGCTTYSGPETCQECNTSSILSYDSKTCQAIQAVSNCQTYSAVKCLSCNETFSLQPLANQTQLNFMMANNPSNLNPIFDMAIDSKELLENSCKSIRVTNCAELENFFTCRKCNNGYYLKNGQCQANPKESIKNCLVYKTLSHCIKCVFGYFNKSETECTRVSEVDYCVAYD